MKILYLFLIIAIYFGIAVNNCTAGSANGNFIRSNNITGFYTPTSNSSPNNDPNLRGIVQALSPVFSVTCNTTKNTTRGIEFAGTNMGTTFRNNTMSQHRYGFVLDQNGVIGTQGSPSSPADNQWTGAWLAGNFKTATLGGSTAQNSKMYVRSNANYNPNGSGTSAPFDNNNIYSTTAIPPTLFVLNNPSPPLLACFQIISFPNLIKNMEVIAQDSILVGDVYEEAVRYIAKNGVFRNLKEQLELTDSSNVLAAFYLESMESSREKLFRIEKKLAGENIQEGTLEQLTFVPQNEIETNSKEFHRIQIRKINQVLTEQDVLDLKIIAEKCPFTEGEVVYKARAMYSELSDSVQVFEDPCVEGSGLKSFLTENSEMQTERNTIAIFPNPAKNEVNILFNGNDFPEYLEITITDLNGKIVYQNTSTKLKNGLSTIHVEVENGIYFIHVNNKKSNEYFIEKLIIKQ